MQPQYSYPSQPLGPTPAPPFAGPRFGAGVAQQRPMVRGFIVATVGNVVAVLAYFALHYIEIPLAGGYSGSQLAGLISAAYSFASNACSTFQQAGSATSCSVPPFDPALVLWAEVALAAAAAVLAGLQWFRVRQSGELGNRRATVGILVCSLLSLLLIVGLVLILQASANVLLSQANTGGSVDLIPFLGIGYWLMLLGTVAGFVGAIMQLRGGPLQ